MAQAALPIKHSCGAAGGSKERGSRVKDLEGRVGSGRPTGRNSRQCTASIKCSSSRISNNNDPPYSREDSSSSLEILPPEDSSRRKHSRSKEKSEANDPWLSQRPSSSNSRPGSSSSTSGKRAPPVHKSESLPLRTPTPTKQVSLQAVRRKESDESSLGDIDWSELQALEESRLQSQPGTSEGTDSEMARANSLQRDMKSLSLKTQDALSDTKSSRAQMETPSAGGREVQQGNKLSGKNTDIVDIEDSDEFDTDLESDESEDSDTEEEPIKAPNELFMEFIGCMMEKDYQNAQKLCKMILMYEPDHAEALTFQPLIEEKIQLEEELANQPSDSDDDSGEESGDSDDDDDDEDDDDSSDDDSDSSETDEDEEDVDTESKPDSGISSATNSVIFS